LTVGRNVSDYLKRIGVYGKWNLLFPGENYYELLKDS
jgi:hypothetical protein